MSVDYAERLKIPVLSEGPISLFTKTGLKIARGYVRVVLGGRGPYVEFESDHILLKNTIAPAGESWRSYNHSAYYDERRTRDSANVKLYHQRKEVDYADYKIGLIYISPFDLYNAEGEVLIEPLRKKKAVKPCKLRGLFD